MYQQLPIYEVIPQLKSLLSINNTVLLHAPPGAGKSTIVPLELLPEPWLADKKILVLEPRKLAARSVAQRMSELLNTELGESVGYRVRFDTCVSTHTRIEVLTEGILTRLIQEDNSLENVGMVIFDEFHERSLNADLALALCREIQQVLRPDLRILVMSATLDYEQLSSLLGGAPVVESAGRQYPVEIYYEKLPKEAHICDKAKTVITKALAEQKGDLLVFLPGVGEINRLLETLEENYPHLDIFPLHGNLSLELQKKAIAPSKSGTRKIVLATSIAETSLTIEGITTVIDSGLMRKNMFDPKSGLSKTVTVAITLDAADQRAGRAGRTAAGVCYRLWDTHTHEHLHKHRSPEILEADLASLTLELATWGQNDPQALTWLTPPPKGALAQAQDLLTSLDALAHSKITAKGKLMSQMGTHPRLAHLFLEAKALHALALATDLAAVLEEKDPLYGKQNSVDICLRLEALRRYRAGTYKDHGALQRIEKLASEWRKHLKVPHADSSAIDLYQVGLLLAYAFPERIAKRKAAHSQQYQLANGRVVVLDSQDDLARSEYLVIPELDLRADAGKVFSAAVVDPKDLSYLYTESTVCRWDSTKDVFLAQTETRIGAILIQSKPLAQVNEQLKSEAICEAVSQNQHLLDFSDKALNLINRVSSLASWLPDRSWPNWSVEYLCDNATEWLAPYVNGVKTAADLKKLNLVEILTNHLTWEQQQELENLAPAKIEVPSGFEIELRYQAQGEVPVLAVRLQELFGMLESPKICHGKINVLMHLLSPGYKPVQITGDLNSFWTNTYKEVKSELQRRYPKHSWPEDPFTAKAVRGVVRKK